MPNSAKNASLLPTADPILSEECAIRFTDNIDSYLTDLRDDYEVNLFAKLDITELLQAQSDLVKKRACFYAKKVEQGCTVATSYDKNYANLFNLVGFWKSLPTHISTEQTVEQKSAALESMQL